MKRDMPIIGLFVLIGFVCGIPLGWQVGWRHGAADMRDSLLCLTARISDDHFDAEARKYCVRIGTPIAQSSAKAATKAEKSQ